MTDQTQQIAAEADLIEHEARNSYRTLHRPAAVQDVATGTARGVTARLASVSGHDEGSEGELHIAHQIIAELAMRLAEKERE